MCLFLQKRKTGHTIEGDLVAFFFDEMEDAYERGKKQMRKRKEARKRA